jgi:hypothetical protein
MFTYHLQKKQGDAAGKSRATPVNDPIAQIRLGGYYDAQGTAMDPQRRFVPYQVTDFHFAPL